MSELDNLEPTTQIPADRKTTVDAARARVTFARAVVRACTYISQPGGCRECPFRPGCIKLENLARAHSSVLRLTDPVYAAAAMTPTDSIRAAESYR